MSKLIVYDTNVFVSYLLSPNKEGTIKTVVERIREKQAIPVYSDAIMAEYDKVLHYTKFGFSHATIRTFLQSVVDNGCHVVPVATSVYFRDESDKCFYDAAISAHADWLITGNKSRLRTANAGFAQRMPFPRRTLHCKRDGVLGAHRRKVMRL